MINMKKVAAGVCLSLTLASIGVSAASGVITTDYSQRQLTWSSNWLTGNTTGNAITKPYGAGLGYTGHAEIYLYDSQNTCLSSNSKTASATKIRTTASAKAKTKKISTAVTRHYIVGSAGDIYDDSGNITTAAKGSY